MSKKIVPLTLCVIQQGDKVLLGMKKRGFGAGRWNGFGGKLDEGEAIIEAAHREIEEEVGLKVNDLAEIGVINFEFETTDKILEVHIFKATEFEGEPTETEEMKPQWFAIDEIPYSQMWSDDKYWIPYLLENKRFKGKFLFDKPATAEHEGKILEHYLEEIA